MSVKTTVEPRNGYLVITSVGVRDDFNSVLEGSRKIKEAVETHQVNYVLADYRKLSFNVPMQDALNLSDAYVHDTPEFKNIIIGVVTNRKDLEQGRFWESICDKKGYENQVFLDIEKADNWIQSQIKSEVLNV
jgi:hypothetical protein